MALHSPVISIIINIQIVSHVQPVTYNHLKRTSAIKVTAMKIMTVSITKGSHPVPQPN